MGRFAIDSNTLRASSPFKLDCSNTQLLLCCPLFTKSPTPSIQALKTNRRFELHPEPESIGLLKVFEQASTAHLLTASLEGSISRKLYQVLDPAKLCLRPPEEKCSGFAPKPLPR